MTKKTIPEAQRTLAALKDSHTTDWAADDFDTYVKELDKFLEELYSDISHLQVGLPSSQVQHLASRLLERCCCLHWRARRMEKGDFCPDCFTHGESAGMLTGEIKLSSPRKRHG